MARARRSVSHRNSKKMFRRNAKSHGMNRRKSMRGGIRH